MKKYFIFATALAALASCSSDDFVGESPNGVNSQESGAIAFKTNSKAITRALGAEAAKELGYNFVVEGIKTIGSDPVSEVFDNYNVHWYENTADKTASNTANWEYVGETKNTYSAAYEQTIKYWDFAASQYDFWAYSLGDGSATVSGLAHDATLGSSAYTFTGTAAALSKVFISDLVTAYNSNAEVCSKPNGVSTWPFTMGNEVTLTFRSLVAKVRVGLYETIPGYSVRNVQFYPASGSATGNATLYTEVGHEIPNSGECTVYFPSIGKNNIKTGSPAVDNPDYNKAHVSFGGTGATKEQSPTFGTLAYGTGETNKHEHSGNSNTIWLARSASAPTWAVESGKSSGDYSIVLPNESGSVLTLKVDYTLEPIDGTEETITVHGATALIPSQYAQWKSNYAYTYLFKISDNTNGLTNVTVTDKVGLYPITLNAVVVGSTDGTQETITTVATPSITTYSLTSDVTTNNEYTASDDIYVTASEDGTLMSLTGKATLYDITKNNAAYGATEAEVLAALTTYSTLASDTYTGRNGVVLTPVSGALDLTVATIPTVDGQTYDISAGQAAFINHSENKLAAGHYYAFVYLKTAGETAVAHYEAVTVAAGDAVTGLYTTSTGSDVAAEVDNEHAQTLYAKYYTVANAVYGIKVIKMIDE